MDVKFSTFATKKIVKFKDIQLPDAATNLAFYCTDGQK
jgi:hypothetical protein